MISKPWRVNLRKWSLVHVVKLTITFLLHQHRSRLIIELHLFMECIHVDICLNSRVISLFSWQNNWLLFWLDLFYWLLFWLEWFYLLLLDWWFLLLMLFNLRFNWNPFDFIFAHRWRYYFLNKWSTLRRGSFMIWEPRNLASCIIIR